MRTSMDRLPEELPESVVEALAAGREDLVDARVLEALPKRPVWRAQIAEARSLANDLGLALRAASEASVPPAAELEALVASALAGRPPAPSRRGLVAATALGGGLTAGLAWLSVAGFGSAAGRALALGRWLFETTRAVGRVAELMPGAWLTAAVVVIGAGLLLLALPARALLRSATLAVLLGLLGSSMPASAQRFTGEWPDEEPPLSLSLDDRAADEVLETAARAAGLDLVSHLRDAPRVSVHVRNASFREVAAAVLPSDAYEVRRQGRMVVVREREEPEAPAPDPPGDGAARDASAPDRASLGEDVVVGPDERVRSVFTMGGDAEVRGEVLGDVLTMGGDVEVRSGARVGGDVMTMGGDVHLEPDAEVRGEVATMGGELRVDEGARASRVVSPASVQVPEPRSWLARAASAGVSFGLLFLLGLLLVGGMRERHANLVRAVVKEPLRSLAAGLLGGGVVAVGSVLLAITLVGIPAALVLLLGAVVGAYVGVAVSASVVGAVLPLPWLQGRPIAQLAAGVGTLYVCWLLPTGVGTVAVLLLATLGFGAVLVTRFGGRAARS